MYVAFAGGERMWMLISFFVAFPACVLAYVNAKKRDAVADIHNNRPEFVPYAHLRIRTKVVSVNKHYQL